MPRQAPDPRRIKRSRLPLVIGLAALLLIAIMSIGGVVIAAIGAGSGGGFSFPMGDRVGLLKVEGVLGEGPGFGADTAWLADQVRDWANDSSVKGMVIRVNSPGGAVSATQDLVQAIEEFQAEGKPVYTSMGDIAASGGVYVAMASDKIFANSGTLTGSVGVIMSFWGYRDLVDRIGLEPRTIKSGKYKDIGSGARPMEQHEKELLETMIDDVYEQFFGFVLEARTPAVREMLAQQHGGDVSDEQVEAHLRQYADGRIFSGRQAIEYGYVDGLGSLQDTIDAMIADLGLDPKTRITENRKKPAGLFGPAFQFMHSLKNKAPGNVAIEYRFSM